MAKHGYKILDSDMHVFEPHDLYLRYMNPNGAIGFHAGNRAKTHGQIKFTFADGKPIRASGTQVLAATSPKQNAEESSPGEAEVAQRYAKPLARRSRRSIAIGSDGRRRFGRGDFVSNLPASLR